jgi:hypothetical protein
MYVSYSADILVSCTPIALQWDFNLQFTYVNQKALFTTALATDVATDCKHTEGAIVHPH